MLVSIGARTHGDDVVDLLAACHRHIREHVVLARRLVVRGPESPPEEIRETAARIRRYFEQAFPLHVADEEQSIAPRLAAADGVVIAAVKLMALDHREHQRLIDALIALCVEAEQRPTELARINARLSKVVELVASDLASHLEMEERIVFPALRALPGLHAEIREEMRQRRV